MQKLETVLGSDPTHLVDNKQFVCFCISLLVHFIVLLQRHLQVEAGPAE